VEKRAGFFPGRIKPPNGGLLFGGKTAGASEEAGEFWRKK